MDAGELFKAGKLQQAVDAALADVRRNPTAIPARLVLAELLCFTGDLDRADRQLDAIGKDDPKVSVAVMLFRRVIRAEQARQDFHTQGRVPEFLEEPGERIRLHLEASISLREGNRAQAAELLARAESMRPMLSGTLDGQPFSDFRDLDDLTSSVLEVLTAGGQYYWAPLERIERIEFQPYETPRDLLWRQAHLVFRTGQEADVFLPSLYAGTHAESDDQLRLGQASDWRHVDDPPVRGVGQRLFLAGEADQPILQLGRIAFNAPAEALQAEADDDARQG